MVLSCLLARISQCIFFLKDNIGNRNYTCTPIGQVYETYLAALVSTCPAVSPYPLSWNIALYWSTTTLLTHNNRVQVVQQHCTQLAIAYRLYNKININTVYTQQQLTG